jgi:hypothetical protein
MESKVQSLEMWTFSKHSFDLSRGQVMIMWASENTLELDVLRPSACSNNAVLVGVMLTASVKPAPSSVSDVQKDFVRTAFFFQKVSVPPKSTVSLSSSFI